MTTSPIVATIPTGIAIAEFSRQTKALTRKHGDGLLMRQHEGKFLVLDRPAPEFNCWCARCHRTVHGWLKTALPDSFPMWPFIVCPDCGDKRCPRAGNHTAPCQTKETT